MYHPEIDEIYNYEYCKNIFNYMLRLSLLRRNYLLEKKIGSNYNKVRYIFKYLYLKNCLTNINLNLFYFFIDYFSLKNIINKIRAVISFLIYFKQSDNMND